ncbi:MAG TPA: RNA methyltransferase [Candidatus Baltobacteraceae bacterium]|nr:RNA methyltransferase [Candidatus Baltobacteraceae bacterium]
MPTALGPHNPRLALVHRLLAAAGRREQRRFVAEGATLLAEADRSGAAPREVYATERGVAADEAAALLARWETAGVPVFTVPDRAFDRLSDLESATGLLGVFDVPVRSAADVLARPGTVLVLAGVNDPGNAGTLVRSAEAFGAAGVLFGRGGVDPYNPKVVRGAMGSLFRVAVAQTDAGELLAACEASGRPLIAAAKEGEDVRAAGLPANAVVAVGNERRGVRDWLPRWDRAVRIPQREATESLNAAVAGSIVLYELSRCQDPCQAAEKP